VINDRRVHLDEIRQGPHWRFLVRPEPFVDERLGLGEAKRTIANTTVRYRGWDFPHRNPHMPLMHLSNSIASMDHFHGHKEYWQFFQSGQFLYLAAVRETLEQTWAEKLADRVEWPTQASRQQARGYIDVVNLVYTMTEFFEFAARIGQSLPGVEAMHLAIGLRNARASCYQLLSSSELGGTSTYRRSPSLSKSGGSL
jgi:hypothetical protein